MDTAKAQTTTSHQIKLLKKTVFSDFMNFQYFVQVSISQIFFLHHLDNPDKKACVSVIGKPY